MKHRGHRDIDSFANHLARVVYDYHGAIVEIGDSLVIFLPFLQDEDSHGLAGKHDRLQGIGQFVDVQDFDALKLRDFVQIEVIGDDLALVQLG